ncbi:hypothetical protein GLIP_2160 [Aliiglaciecola lipolytica E3]|uniref:Uncharacterized protein n=1 Tax=Aliiglaciecola lipolytica E3 TaxID=1127673 RepID=K6YDU9_9ALTE|nr:hypothetical protein GLIP_2160 [Aliiglaciecola lipolytica E3]
MGAIDNKLAFKRVCVRLFYEYCVSTVSEFAYGDVTFYFLYSTKHLLVSLCQTYLFAGF